jgi:DNA excision repair protein ERCC-6
MDARTTRVKKKNRLKELKTKEKTLLDAQRKRILVEKRRKVLSLDDADSEREKLIRTGVITPFENTSGEQVLIQPPKARIPKLKQQAEAGPSETKKRKQPQKEEKPSKRKRVSSDEEGEEEDEEYTEFEDRDEFVADEEELEEEFFDEEEDQPKKKKKKRTPKVEAKSDEEVLDDGDETRYLRRLRAFLDSREIQYTDEDNLAELTKNYTSGFEQAEIAPDFMMPKNIHDQLFDYQKTGVRWMWELHKQGAGGIVGDEMGLGKTIVRSPRIKY